MLLIIVGCDGHDIHIPACTSECHVSIYHAPEGPI